MVRHKGSNALSLVAYFYPTHKDAFRSLVALQDVDQNRGLRSLGVSDAAVMSEAEAGKLRIDRTIEYHEDRPQTLAEVFPPSIICQPAVGPELPVVSEHFSALGFHANVLREIAENLPPEGAALVLLLEEEWPDELKAVLGNEVYLERWALEVEE